MTTNELTDMYERDIRRFIEELGLFTSEENVWKTTGSIKNPAGNLALHIVGGLNHHIGATLAGTGYIRDRDREFSDKGISRNLLVEELRKLIPLISQTIIPLTPEQLNSPFPKFFDKESASTSYVLTQLLLHLNYHLGQVNYLRRALEP